jgi:hypothetical protein
VAAAQLSRTTTAERLAALDSLVAARLQIPTLSPLTKPQGATVGKVQAGHSAQLGQYHAVQAAAALLDLPVTVMGLAAAGQAVHMCQQLQPLAQTAATVFLAFLLLSGE